MGKPLLKKCILIGLCVVLGLQCSSIIRNTMIIPASYMLSVGNVSQGTQSETNKEYIKWMEFNAPLQILEQALKYDIQSYTEETPLNWIELLAYTATKNWGSFPKEKKSAEMDKAVARLRAGETIAEITKDMKLYDFYLTAYSAVLNGFVGEYEEEVSDPEHPGETVPVKKYGLKAFSPVAKGYSYSHYDDFGVSRSYGFRRKHQGNDLMGNVGTPIIAVEDGYIDNIGWNQYGGWRIGIRSYDQKRYYYYAHLRKDQPFVKTLKEGDPVQAGDVIGYLGMTGYSAKENVNNISTPHLHFGLQIIFDESQKEGNNQIWIDVYNLVRLLEKNKMSVSRDEENKEFVRTKKINSIVID